MLDRVVWYIYENGVVFLPVVRLQPFHHKRGLPDRMLSEPLAVPVTHIRHLERKDRQR